MELILTRELIVESDEIPNVEGHEAALFLYRERKLITIGSSLSFLILGVNNIETPFAKRMGQTCMDILIQEEFQPHHLHLRAG
jgi:hypothetical protein